MCFSFHGDKVDTVLQQWGNGLLSVTMATQLTKHAAIAPVVVGSHVLRERMLKVRVKMEF